MDQATAVIFLEEHFNDYCQNALIFLRESLQIPPEVLAFPVRIKAYVNGQSVRIFTLMDDVLEAERGSYALAMYDHEQSACYAPGSPGIFIDTAILAGDARDAHLSEESLLTILLAHECVHVVMMSRFAALNEAAAQDWCYSERYRYIHEVIALRFCDRLANPDMAIATRADIDAYLAYVEHQAGQVKAGSHYQPYFGEHKTTPDDKLWNALVEGLDGIDALRQLAQ
ncbi:hypothetical protein [Paraburkholderia dilworthii]|uniref:Peptidase MA superfamily protein n=1 Tax=Paraburkholderia dilworthii TaxID=948106 RepID=A0ABW9CYN8_9BURK